jgi:hypothetical protein
MSAWSDTNTAQPDGRASTSPLVSVGLYDGTVHFYASSLEQWPTTFDFDGYIRIIELAQATRTVFDAGYRVYSEFDPTSSRG